MEFSSRRRSRRVWLTGDRDPALYPHALQLYRKPPTGHIALAEFQQFAVERLKVLKVLENAGNRFIKGSDAYNANLDTELHKLPSARLFLSKSRSEISDEEFDRRRWDHISHFILRLAYCKTEDMRRWFIAQELDLFHFRYSHEDATGLRDFFLINNLVYEPIDADEQRELREQLIECGVERGTAHVDIENAYYRVPFTDVLDLVRKHKVFLKRGFAYVQQTQLVHVVGTLFRSRLSKAMAVTCRDWGTVMDDERLGLFIRTLANRHVGENYASNRNEGSVTAEMVDGLSRASFPLCMQSMHAVLRQSHHLKHGARMQYGLFLKGIGLSLNESLRFWSREFTKIMDQEKFDKGYAYNIRHNYGKEGKRADYTPFSCMKIISSNAPGPGDCHGCPFRHWDSELVRQRLQSLKVEPVKLDKIMEKVRHGHYQIACTRHFEAMHGLDIDSHSHGINHPNQFFEESRQLVAPAEGGRKVAGASNGRTPVIPKRSVAAADSEPLEQKPAVVEMSDAELQAVADELM